MTNLLPRDSDLSMRIAVLFVVTAAALACSRSTATTATTTTTTSAAVASSTPAPSAPLPLVEIAPAAEKGFGFQDLIFTLVEREKLSSGAERVRARGLHKGTVVQFDVELGVEWKSGAVKPLRIFSGYVTIRSIGDDASLVRALDAIYGTKLAPEAMKPAIKLPAAALSGDPQSLDAGPLRMKLFYEDDKDDTKNAELYLNIDVASHVVELAEKDEEYRAAIVKAFAR